jgi:hypothetical protein
MTANLKKSDILSAGIMLVYDKFVDKKTVDVNTAAEYVGLSFASSYVAPYLLNTDGSSKVPIPVLENDEISLATVAASYYIGYKKKTATVGATTAMKFAVAKRLAKYVIQNYTDTGIDTLSLSS